MASVLPRLLPALWLTIEISLISLVLALLIGINLGTLQAYLRPGHPLRRLLRVYVFFVRGTPVLVQIFGAFFLLPVLGIELAPFWVGVIALTFNSAGYQIEIARAAIESIDKGQKEGGLALGLEAWQVQWLIILPQALKRMIPPLTNELSQVVKASSVLSVISVFELHKASNALASTSFKYIEVLTLQAALYFIVIHGLSLLSRHLEHRLPGGSGLGASSAVR